MNHRKNRNHRDAGTQRKAAQKKRGPEGKAPLQNERGLLSSLLLSVCFLCVSVSLWLGLPVSGAGWAFTAIHPARQAGRCLRRMSWRLARTDHRATAPGACLAGRRMVGLQQEGRARPAPPGENFVLLGNAIAVGSTRAGAVYLRDGRLLSRRGAAQTAARVGAEPVRSSCGRDPLSVPEGSTNVESYIAGLQQEKSGE